ncbi:hypothetical protein RclHR1_00830004 [Rhizophagus clarus]|uniref:Kinase-like domain-containing protein n=1 Tax=Rhizophagus clarus TaxID=94130 RepID=A0A2Z6S6V8_9GLOM|nr:hypothetical protein RclHR1_00830004 [Rhizophagus clarus]GES99704.1 kinase-like domain-containing protein [Rhizophagus clarus]
MSTDTLSLESRIEKENIKFYDYNEFIDIKEISVNKTYSANWKLDEKPIVLKSFNLDNDVIEEIINELHRNGDFNNVIMETYGITKTNSDNYFLVVEYADRGSLRSYLDTNLLSLDWRDKYRLALQLSKAIEYLHEREIVHKDLHSGSILIRNNSIMLADSGLSKRIRDASQNSSNSFDTIPYIDPRGIDEEKYELNKKSDVYSVGVLLWELTSRKKPFADYVYDSSLIKRITQGLREEIVEGTPEEYSNLYSKCWDFDPDKRPTIREVVATLSSQQTIQQFKLNHGLFLNGYDIVPSNQAIFIKDGKLNSSSYEGQPLVYTSINDRNSRVNLLSFNSDDDDVELNESLRPSDICVNFPVTEITYNVDLSESFSNFTDEEIFYDTYGHLFPKKILIGGKLFIGDLNSATSTQIDMFKFFLTCVYDSIKNKRENPFKYLSTLNFIPKIMTSNRENLDSYEKLINWMNNLFQDVSTDIISYEDLIPISQLKLNTISLIDEKLPGIFNFKEKLTLDDWVGNSKFISWVKKFKLLHGLIIDQELGNSEEIAIDLINFPNILDSNDKFCLEIVKLTNTLEEILINNNILFVTDDDKDINSFPFIKLDTKHDDLSCEDLDHAHFLVKSERYKISLDRNDIKPSEKFKNAIENALDNMMPLICLQEVFNKYGYFFPLNIILGKSLKNVMFNTTYTSKRIDLESPIFESLKSHLEDFNISHLLTQNGNVIEENELSDWIQNTNDLEIIEFNNIISLYDILEIEQKRRIDIVVNKQNDYKIIMTGSVELKDLKVKNTKKIKINIEPSLKNENYEVFGSIISKDNIKLDDVIVTFGPYEIDKFTATIKTLGNTTFNMKGCYIMWIIIGNPSKLSVFSPKNRDVKVEYFKESLKLQRNISSYSIKTSHQLSQGYDISINCSKPINIKLTGWSNNRVYFNISNLSINFNYADNIEVAICILDYENSKIDVSEGIYSGYVLTAESNFSEESMIKKKAYSAQEYLNCNYPTKKLREEETKLYINNRNLIGHLDLSDFVNLKKLNCSENQITSLDISKNELLTELDCYQNKLTNLDLSNCSNIIYVNVHHNYISDIKLPIINNVEYLNLLDNLFYQNLSCFCHFVYLKELHIENNKFIGSLEHLRNLVKLKSLSISNTDIDSGLEYLPDSVENFRCLANERPEAKVKKIYEQLMIYAINKSDAYKGRYNLRAWKVNWKLVKEKEALQNQIKQDEKIDDKFIELAKEEGKLQAKEEELLKKNEYLEQEIKHLREMVEDLKAKLEQKEKGYQEILQQLKVKEEELKSSAAEHYIKKEELQIEVNILNQELLTKEEDVKQSEKQLEETNRELETKEEESTNLKHELDQIKLSYSNIDDKRAKLRDIKQKLNYEKWYTKADTTQLRKQIEKLKTEINSLQSQVKRADKIEKELEEIKKNKDDLQNEKILQQGHIEKLQKDKETLQHKLEVRNSELKDKEELISELQQENKRRIDGLQTKLSEETRKYQNSQEELNALNDQLKVKEELIQQNMRHIDELQRRLDEETRKYQNSQEKLSAIKKIFKETE